MKRNKLGLWLLTALVVGNMVGSGIFMLPRSLSAAASPAGVLLGWAVTGAGVLMLALVFGNLAIRKPELSGGPQIYAKALFKKSRTLSVLAGFMSSWGYWIGNIAGYVAVITTFASYLSIFFPVMNSKNVLFTVGAFELKAGNAVTFVICSVLLWGTHALILRGIESAGKFNFVATVAKVIGFFLFIVIALFAFQQSNIGPFVDTRTSGGETVGLLGQVNSAAVATLWAFIGIESAVVFASRAKKEGDVKKATILGLVISLIIYVGISILTMGLLTQSELQQSQNPLVDAISSILGSTGGNVLAIVGLISLIGSTVGWVLLSSEVPYQAAKQNVFFTSFTKVNEKGMPTVALWISNAIAQVLLLSTVSNSIASAFDFIIYVATLAYLVPYLISSVYQLKLGLTGETYENGKGRALDIVVAVLATVYSAWVVVAGTADIKTFLLGVAMIVSGIIFYPFLLRSLKGKKEEKDIKQSA